MGALPHCKAAGRARERASGIPGCISSIVMKLLTKTAEERYQTAAGVEADLRRCLSGVAVARPHRSIPAVRA